MSFIMEHSCETARPELELFTQLATQTSVEDGYYVEYAAKNSLTDGPILFEVNGDGTDYIDLLNSYLFLELKLLKLNGDKIDADAVVSCVNNLIDALFNQLIVKLNDALVSESNNTYHYRAYIEKLLSYGSEPKANQLSAGLWYKTQLVLWKTLLQQMLVL